ncbi:MAG: HAMP domain-containing protein [Rhodocyclaceae bacterium]|nr:HAMP domain-containing protein [Rhodocyclaceae bacterium]
MALNEGATKDLTPPRSTPGRGAPSRWLPATVRWITLLAVLVGLAVALLVGVTIERVRGEDGAYRQLEQDLARTTRVIALSMRSHLWDYDRDSAEETVRAMVADDPRVLSVRVMDAATERSFVEYHRPGEAPEGSAVRQLTQTVLARNETIGLVEVRMHVAPYLAEARAAFERNLLLTLAILVVGGAMIMAVLQRRLLRPMAALTEATRALSRGDLARPIQPARRDEVGEVALALEQLRVALLKAFEELRGKNDELASHAAVLEERVEARTRELSLANQELNQALSSLRETQEGLIEAEKLASLGRLVAGVAHELNTPLGNATTVLTSLDRDLVQMRQLMDAGQMRRSDLDGHLGTSREGLDILLRNVTRAADLVRSFKRLAIDQTTDMRREFSIRDLVDEVRVSVQPSFRHTPFRICTELADVRLDSYPGPLGQVLTNLLVNALRHGFAERDHGTVTISAEAPIDGQLVLVCRDDGAGMAPDVLRRVFEPFFTTRLGQEGSGLGLHIARNIVLGLLGGRIEASSVEGQGSEFRVTLPVVAPVQRT